MHCRCDSLKCGGGGYMSHPLYLAILPLLMYIDAFFIWGCWCVNESVLLIIDHHLWIKWPNPVGRVSVWRDSLWNFTARSNAVGSDSERTKSSKFEIILGK